MKLDPKMQYIISLADVLNLPPSRDAITTPILDPTVLSSCASTPEPTSSVPSVDADTVAAPTSRAWHWIALTAIVILIANAAVNVELWLAATR